MPLKALRLKPGINRENLRYQSEGGWFESDKIRFRQGTPEVIGGWEQVTSSTYLGVCRSLWTWTALNQLKNTGVGTNLKFYTLQNTTYYDITPIRLPTTTAALVNPFTTSNGLTTVSVADTAHGAAAGDLVSFTGGELIGGVPALDLNQTHIITSITDANNYVITVATAATSTVAGAGGAAVTAVYYFYNVKLANNPFAVVNGSTTATVTAAAHGARVNDFVTFSGATAIGGLTISGEYQITSVTDVNTYTITAASASNATASGGGANVEPDYQINTGTEVQQPAYGWGAGPWSSSTWGSSAQAAGVPLRVWSQMNYGEDLVFGPRGGGIYYWDSSAGTGTRATNLALSSGASYVPVVQNVLLVSDSTRIVIAYGTNEIDSTTLDPLLIRWSDSEDALSWYPEITNLAGSYRLSSGSLIYAAMQVRQEILVWTDNALYSQQFLGAPEVYGFNILASNISCAGPNCVAVAAGVTYWMGIDKFYKYDGTVATLRCDLRSYVFDDLDHDQGYQIFAATNEGFNEVWWFYCTEGSTTVDSYVVYNYAEDVWYYGTMARTAWLDTGLNTNPIAATYSNNLVQHEVGTDDGETTPATAINAYVISAQFDIDDGHNFAFIWRLLPDITFAGSSTTGITPTATFTLYPAKNSGSGYTVPPSVGGSSSAAVTRVGAYNVDQFTGQVSTRVRGRQLAIGVSSNTVGTTWQLGTPRIDTRVDGRK